MDNIHMLKLMFIELSKGLGYEFGIETLVYQTTMQSFLNCDEDFDMYTRTNCILNTYLKGTNFSRN